MNNGRWDHVADNPFNVWAPGYEHNGRLFWIWNGRACRVARYAYQEGWFDPTDGVFMYVTHCWSEPLPEPPVPQRAEAAKERSQP